MVALQDSHSFWQAGPVLSPLLKRQLVYDPDRVADLQAYESGLYGPDTFLLFFRELHGLKSAFISMT